MVGGAPLRDEPQATGSRGFDPARFIARHCRDGYCGFVDLRYVGHGPDHIELMVPYRPELVVGPGIMADDIWITLADMAGTLAVWTRLGAFRPHATVDLRVNHLDPPIAEADILAHAQCHHMAPRIASVRGVVRNAPGHDIASFLASYMFTD